MKRNIVTVLASLFIVLATTFAVYAQIGDPNTRLTLPVRGQTIRGTIVIQGTAKSTTFARYELAYAPEPDLANWVVFGGEIQPVDNGQLGVWNSRPLADGNYALRLQVFNTDGSVNETMVRSLALANAASAPTPDTSTIVTQTASTPDTVTDVQSARDTLQVIGDTVGELPGAFARGGRYALIALAALAAYNIVKRVLLFVLPRVFKRRVDYGR